MSAALTFENVGVRYGGRAALRDVTAKFTAGAVTGIVGPNGAGKTTLLRAALGLLPLAGGTVRIQDRDLKDWSREALGARHRLSAARRRSALADSRARSRRARPPAASRNVRGAVLRR